MLPQRQLKAALNVITPVRVSGVFYRSVAESAIHSLSPPRPLYSLGPRRTGQRFTPKGGPARLYLSERFDVSYVETNGTALSLAAHGHAFVPPPTVVVAVLVDIEHVLDLTVLATKAALATDDAELGGPWFEQMILGRSVPSHDLARAAYSVNLFEAIKFNSAQRPGAVNLMIWPKKLSEPYYVEVHDDSHRL
jgi:RES domain-containing protein